jgi:uncharacterized protein YndB with AHSA1/START domain
MTSNAAAKEYKGRKFVITREYVAPRELVFKAWTDPTLLVKWWGPNGFTNPVCEWDAKPGMAIYVVMRGPDGTDYPMGGKFKEVAAPGRLVFSCGAMDGNRKLLFEFLHTVSFAEAQGRTRVTVSSIVTMTTPDAGRYIGGFKAGMTQSLGRLARLVE